MTWEGFYLICFLVGFGLSLLSLLAGSVDWQLPHLHVHDGIHIPHGDLTGAGGDGGAGVNGVDGSNGGSGHADSPGRGSVSWFNLGNMAAFLAWFGGTGFLLHRFHSLWFGLVLGISTVSGIAGASLVFWFLAKFLMGHEAPLDPIDFEMAGVLGKLSLPIRAGGTGELIYSQEGTRHVSAARSDDGRAIPKGTEVMVTRYEKGIAYVRPWEDALGENEFTQ